jgi:hypothetical protein
MALFDQILKVTQLVNRKVLTQLDRAPSSYTPDAKSARVRQQIETKLAALTPEMAPTVPFTKNGGLIKLTTANVFRWRFFEVAVASLSPGSFGRQKTNTPFEAAITIEINYAVETITPVSVNGVTTYYNTLDLRTADDELLDSLIRAEDLFSAPVLNGAAIKTLEGAYDIGDTVRRHRYAARWERAWE